MNKPTPRQWRSFYDRAAPALVIFCLLASLFSSVGVWYNDRVNGAQDRQRTEDNTALLACFDDFASDLAGGLPPVREATAAANQALSEALRALQVGLVKVGTGAFEESDLRAIIAEFEEYQTANDELAEVRKEHPYPDAPSTFCPAD